MKLMQLGDWLRMYRSYAGITDEQLAQINKRLIGWRQRLNISSLESLENGDSRYEYRRDVSLSDIIELLNAYGMSELVVDHLQVGRTPNLVKQILEQFDRHTSCSQLGLNAEYFVPTAILRNEDRAKLLRETTEPYPDAFPVRVILPNPGDYSQRHDHPGEEILICLRGNVKIHFDETNIFAELGPNDYAHFYADQSHTAINIGNDPAELFVIRAYLLAQGPRRRLYENAKEFEDALLKPDQVNKVDVCELRRIYKSGIGPWLKQTLRVLSGTTEDTPKIADPIGLARQLRAMGLTGPRLHQIAEVKKNEGLLRQIYGRRKYEQFCSGFLEADADIDDLDDLAKICGIPSPLLYGYLFNRVPGISVIRYEHDLQPVPGRTSQNGDAAVQYLYPRHNLADSSLTISFLKMPGGTSSNWNDHSGSELCLPVQGAEISVEVQTGRNKVISEKVTVSPRGFLHYCSHFRHRVINESPSPASVLIVRFFDTMPAPET